MNNWIRNNKPNVIADHTEESNDSHANPSLANLIAVLHWLV